MFSFSLWSENTKHKSLAASVCMKVLEKSGNTPFQVVFGFLCSIWEKQSRVEGAKPTSRCWACGRDTFYHTWGHKFPRGRAWFHSAALCTLAHRDRHHWCGSTSHHSHTCRSLHNAAHSSPRGTHPGTCEVKKNPNKQTKNCYVSHKWHLLEV